jgi:hypothetical protein
MHIINSKNIEIMKKYAVKTALLALATVGMLSINSCEKEENNSNRLTLGEVGSVWQCSTEHYTITWTLLNDSTIYSVGENNSEYLIGFQGEGWFNYFIEYGGINHNSLYITLPEVWDSNQDTIDMSENHVYKLSLTDTSFSIDYAGLTTEEPCQYCVYYFSFKKIK